MNVGTLISIAARERFSERPTAMGVRLSPLSLYGATVATIARELRAQLGAKIYIVVSSPDATAEDLDTRAFVAPDQRAAERATKWRNNVKVSAGERLVYVSVDVHPKASGLRDCLEPLTEADLRDAFRKWCAFPKTGVPSNLGDQLEAASLLSSVRLPALFALCEAVAKRGAKGPAAWQAVGESLPLLGLAVDRKLGKEDTADRLTANLEIVRSADTGEKRRGAPKGYEPLVESLRAALANAKGGDRLAALSSVDIGEAKTAHIAKSPSSSKSKRSDEPKKSKHDDEPKKSKHGDEPKKPKNQSASGATKKPAPVQPNAEPESPAAGAAAVLGQDAGSAPTPKPAVRTAPPGVAPKPAPRTVRLVGAELPAGLSGLLSALIDGDGATIRVTSRVADREVLRALDSGAKTAPVPVSGALARHSKELAAWRSARAAMLSVSRDSATNAALQDALVRGAASLVKDEAWNEAADALADAAIALYTSASADREAVAREALALDTIEVCDAQGRANVRVIGPTHLLSLGQIAVLRRTLSQVSELSDAARALVLRSVQLAPPAPSGFPESSGALRGARAAWGLIAYERVPSLVSDGEAQRAARSVVERYLSLSPHAALTLRVAVGGPGNLAALVDGVAEAVKEWPDPPTKTEILCELTPTLSSKSPALPLMKAGSVKLAGFDAAGANDAHVTLRFADESDPAERSEATAPPAQIASPPSSDGTSFDLRQNVLKVWTSVRGARELEAVERLVARAQGRVARGAFLTEIAGRSLQSECVKAGETQGWLAVIGRSLGRQAQSPRRLLAHEPIGERATCAVVAKDMRAAARSAQLGLGVFGINESRPNTLRTFAERLADSARSSLVPIEGEAATLICGGVLALELRKHLRDEQALVAPVVGASFDTLTGTATRPAHDVLQLGVSRARDGLRFIVGYASAADTPEIDCVALDGAIVKRITRVLEALNAASSSGIEGIAAREAVSWVLWSAVATDEASHATWRETLQQWRGQLAAKTEVLILVSMKAAGEPRSGGKIARAATRILPITPSMVSL
ncbi:MAG: hypothetical protein JNK05_37095 [Myxococcales bacterium]|nr:hypothetical protein [Myxococcales bacterium]